MMTERNVRPCVLYEFVVASYENSPFSICTNIFYSSVHAVAQPESGDKRRLQPLNHLSTKKKISAIDLKLKTLAKMQAFKRALDLTYIIKRGGGVHLASKSLQFSCFKWL